MTLTKADIVEKLTEDLGYAKHKAKDISESLLDIIKSTLESGEDVLVSGFGKFCVKEKRARRGGRNPVTGEEHMIASRRVITFKCSGNLRKRINAG